MAQRVRPGTLTSAIRSRRPRSTTDTEYESGMEVSPTFAAIRRPRVGSNASPFGLTPTAILKAFRSSQGANTETVFSPRLLVKTRPRVSETSAPATAVRSGIDSMYRSLAQSITSIEFTFSIGRGPSEATGADRRRQSPRSHALGDLRRGARDVLRQHRISSADRRY